MSEPSPRRFLWAVPRSLSTAFERWVIERGDHHVIDEPFSAAYYLGPERVSRRYELREPDATASAILSEVMSAPTPLFIKDMIHHVPRDQRESLVGGGEHTLLIRDPRYAIPSFAKVWPDVTWEECGYEDLAEFAASLYAARIPFTVMDAHDLMAEPAAVLSEWANDRGLAFNQESLSWKPGHVPQWKRWLQFHEGAMASTGFMAREPGSPPAIRDERIANLVARAQPLYEELRQ